MRAPIRCALFAGLALLTAACNDQSESEIATREAASSVSSAVIAEKRWLDVSDQTPAERWLASREAATDLPPSAPEVAAYRDLLSRADRRYRETPRMIANRAVQLEEMLAERGIDENAKLVIEGLTRLGAEDESRGFGETGQHYFNIRVTKTSREEALSSLQGLEEGARP